MAFPVPVDARAAKFFEVVLGLENALRVDMDLADVADALAEGEYGKVVVSGGLPKLAKLEVTDVVADPPGSARLCWTKYVPSDSNNGQADVLATKKATVITGKFQAKTKFIDSLATYNPGDILIAVFDAVLGAVLSPVPTGTATAEQVAASVGKVLALSAGVLHYESL